ncbi:MAG: RNA polymerase-binding protein DksA [Hydrogenophaga sp.]|nr:RNA polymerase-binding protein DksA [Hydrogenophaga sp.]
MKAPATRTAKSGKPAASGAKSRAPVASKTATTRSSAKSKAPAKAATKSKVTAKPAATAPVKKAPVKAAVKPAAKKPAPKPVAKKVAVKPAARPAVKKTAPLPVPKASARKPVPSKTTQPAAQAARTKIQPVAKAAAPKVIPPVTKAAPVAVPAPKPSSAKRAATPAPVVVEPTPRPLGKRAAKKVMMEQMTQAAVVPTHAPDAAKATFSQMNERAVMTPPVPSSIQKDPKRANNWKTLSVEQLTDQDVQAMPDTEYMSDLQLAFFRRKLSQLKADMLANAGETTEHLREDTVVVPDPADRATIEEEHALELRTRDRERKLLKKIEQAIARIDSGDYGYCEETGEPIGVGRLMARPTASLSLEAQQRRELKQKMFGD